MAGGKLFIHQSMNHGKGEKIVKILWNLSALLVLICLRISYKNVSGQPKFSYRTAFKIMFELMVIVVLLIAWLLGYVQKQSNHQVWFPLFYRGKNP